MLEEPDDILQVREILWNNVWKSFQATWDDDSMLPIIWTGEASHVTPTYLPPPNMGKHLDWALNYLCIGLNSN